VNNNNHQYYKPFYLPSFTPIFPLESQGDTSTMFFEVKYRIKPSEFKSRLKGGTEFPPLTDIIAYNGKNIIPYWIDKRKYRLLEEKVEFEVCYNTITETYGYTPTATFSKKTITAWTRPAFEPRFDAKIEQLSVYSWTTYQETKTHTLLFASNVHKAKAGDVVKITSSNYLQQESEDFSILVRQEGSAIVTEVTAESITLSEFTFNIIQVNNGMQINNCLSTSEESAFNKSDITFVCTFDIKDLSFGAGIGNIAPNGLYKFKLDAEKRLTIGDTILLSNGGNRIESGTSYTELYAWESQPVIVEDVDEENFYVADFTVTFMNGDTGNYSSVAQLVKGAYVRRESISGRNAYQGDFVGTAEITYIRESELSNLQQSWKAIKGRNFVDTISAGSKPNFDEYNEMILYNVRVLAQPQMAEHLIGDIYKVTSIYINVQ
jgi:hypothetical protein